MSYLVLARKYRPKTFDEVIGQEVVTRVLSGALEEGRVGHAYLLAGPRGTGKTTIARCLAKCLNCEEGPTPRPCGTCERCRAADAGSEVDTIEIDAASHTGVDAIRELRDEVTYAPMRARTKVYIVDEVHMLSKPAFNALLKTLEEPPPHVVFVFATTEPHKVLDTILSRCQVLRLVPLPEDRIAARLEEVFRLEGVRPGPGVVSELARDARGGMRDALSLADKLLALAGDEPTLEDLQRLGGETGARRIEELLTCIEAGDKAGLLRLLGGSVGDEGELLARLLDALRTSVVLTHCGIEAPFVTATEEERTVALERAGRLGPDRLELWMQELLRARERMRLLPGQEPLVLEVTLLDLCRAETSVPLAELVARLEALGAPDARPAQVSTGKTAGPARAAPAPSVSPVSTTAGAGRLAALWKPFLSELAGSHGALASLLEDHAGADRLDEAEDGTVVLRLGALDAGARKLIADRRNQATCSRALSHVAGRSLTVRVVLPDGGDVPVPAESRARPNDAPPASKDEFTQEVADLFGGMIEDVK